MEFCAGGSVSDLYNGQQLSVPEWVEKEKKEPREKTLESITDSFRGPLIFLLLSPVSFGFGRLFLPASPSCFYLLLSVHIVLPSHWQAAV